MTYDLGNFAGQLSADELNGAMRNAGSDFQFGSNAGGMQAPTAPAPQATDAEVPGQPAAAQQSQDGGGLSSILGLVGQFMGGGYGQALSAVGGMMGKKNG